jgi:hypothetical protein
MVLCGVVVNVRAQEAEPKSQTGDASRQPAGAKSPATEPEEQPSESADKPATPIKIDKKLVDAGLKALKSIKPLAPGAVHESFFHISMGPNDPIGYVATSLIGSKVDDKLVYDYKTDTANTFPNRTRFKAVVVAKLQPDFQPIDIELRRNITPETGDERGDVQRAKFGAKVVKLSAKPKGSEEVKTEVPRPDPPFIYGIETVVQLIDFDVHKEFVLREFDVTSGKAGDLFFESQVWKDGTTTVVVANTAGVVSYQFWFDDNNKLLRWGMPSMPVMFIRTTKERVRLMGWEG